MRKILKITVCFLLVFGFSLGFVAHNNNSDALRLILKRVVLEGSKRSEYLTLINSSDEEATYRLLWKEMVMTRNEGVKPINKVAGAPTVPASKDMIKYSPRRVTLAPGTSQQIRMALRTPPNLADGEYRSHLWIRREVDTEKLIMDKHEQVSEKTRRAEIVLLPGVTIPVIVRKGDLDVRASIDSASVVDSGAEYKISITLGRQGQRSTYGDIDFYCNPRAEAVALRSSRGIAIYTELNQKDVLATIAKPQGVSCSEMLIRYVETDNYDGEPVRILAEKIVPVQ